MKLVHVTSSLKVGGAETVLCSLVTYLATKQVAQTVVYVHDGPLRGQLEKAGVSCCHVSGWLFQYDLVFFWRLYCILRRIKPDCIHTLLWAANCAGRLVAWILGIPVVCALHNNIEQDGNIRRILSRMTLPAATRIVAVSREVAAGLPSRYQAAARLAIIHNGINYEQIVCAGFSAGLSRTELGLHAGHVIIGSVGRLEPVKRYDLLLGSIAQLRVRMPHVRLLLIGSGSQEVSLRLQAERLGLLGSDPFVHFIHAYPAYGYYPLMDIFVQTSDREGVSIALLEAMSFGCACVVTQQGLEHPVLTHAYNGILVPAGAMNGLTDALESLACTTQLRNRLGDNARKKVQEEYSACAMHKAYHNLFVRVAAECSKI